MFMFVRIKGKDLINFIADLVQATANNKTTFAFGSDTSINVALAIIAFPLLAQIFIGIPKLQYALELQKSLLMA